MARGQPARGPGADLIGRGAAFLVDLAFDLTPAGWRLVARPGIDQRRAREFLARDLDALHDGAAGYTGPFKVQVAGPWTLAAGLERTRGDRAVVDAGARRDLAQSLAEGVTAHVADVAARLPGAHVIVQLDEPSVPAVLLGGLPTVSGFGKLAAIEAGVVEQELADLIRAIPGPVVVHCCAPRAPLDLFRAAGAGALSFDLGLVQDLDAVGTAIEAGEHLFPGVVPGIDSTLPPPRATASRVQAWWSELGFPADDLAAAVTLTPACGLAGATPGLQVLTGSSVHGRYDFTVSEKVSDDFYLGTARLEQMDRPAQALGVVHIHASGRRDERRAEHDERHVDDPADGGSGEQRNHVSQ